MRPELTGGGVSPSAAELEQDKDQEALSLPVPPWEGKSRHQRKCMFMSVPPNRTPCSDREFYLCVRHSSRRPRVAPEHSKCGRKSSALESSFCVSNSSLQKRLGSGDAPC